MENCQYTSLQRSQQLKQFFASQFLPISSVSTDQWRPFCEELEAHQDGSGEPEILMGQSTVFGEINAEVPLQNENPLNHQIPWQQYMERIGSLSPESKVSRFCKEAGFVRIVEVGQYFVTRDTGEFKQTVACREYTLPRDDKASQPKGWIRGHMRIGPVLEVTTSFQHFKDGIEIRIESVNQDNSQSWVRISYGTVKYVNDSIEDDTKSCRFTRRGKCTNKLKCGCSQVEGKSKTSTEGIYWHNNYTIM